MRRLPANGSDARIAKCDSGGVEARVGAIVGCAPHKATQIASAGEWNSRSSAGMPTNRRPAQTLSTTNERTNDMSTYSRTLITAITLALAIPSAVMAATVDQEFVTKAAQGGLAEVKLGEMASTNGASDAVTTFGEHMVSDHGKANDELKSTATGKGANVPTTPSAEQQATAARLAKLKGAAFDAEYAKVMVKDHQETVALFKKESSAGKDPELKAFAAKTLPTIEQHLKMAQALKPGAAKAM